MNDLHLHNNTQLKKIICFGLAGFIIYVAGFEIYRGRVGSRASATASRMARLRDVVQQFKQTTGAFPKTLADLKLPLSDLSDLMSGETFQYYSEGTKVVGDDDIMLAQPKCYIDNIWPFGKRKRYVVLWAGALTQLKCDQSPGAEL